MSHEKLKPLTYFRVLTLRTYMDKIATFDPFLGLLMCECCFGVPFGHKDSSFCCFLPFLRTYVITHMLLFEYLEYFYQYVLDMAQSSLLCLFT